MNNISRALQIQAVCKPFLDHRQVPKAGPSECGMLKVKFRNHFFLSYYSVELPKIKGICVLQGERSNA